MFTRSHRNGSHCFSRLSCWVSTCFWKVLWNVHIDSDSVLSKPHCIGTKVFRVNVPHEHYILYINFRSTVCQTKMQCKAVGISVLPTCSTRVSSRSVPKVGASECFDLQKKMQLCSTKRLRKRAVQQDRTSRSVVMPTSPPLIGQGIPCKVFPESSLNKRPLNHKNLDMAYVNLLKAMGDIGNE